MDTGLACVYRLTMARKIQIITTWQTRVFRLNNDKYPNVYRKRGFWVFAWGSVIRISWFIDSSSLMLLRTSILLNSRTALMAEYNYRKVTKNTGSFHTWTARVKKTPASDASFLTLKSILSAFSLCAFRQHQLVGYPCNGIDCAGRGGIDSATWTHHQLHRPSSTQPRAGCSLELLCYWKRIVLRIVTIFIYFLNTILVISAWSENKVPVLTDPPLFNYLY